MPDHSEAEAWNAFPAAIFAALVLLSLVLSAFI